SIDLVAEQFLDDRELVLPNFGKREAHLRVIRRAVSPDPAELRMLPGKIARQAPAVIVLVDADPRMNLQPDLMPVADGLGECVEGSVIVALLFGEDLDATLFADIAEEFLVQRF